MGKPKSFKYDYPDGFDPHASYPWAVNRQVFAWVPPRSRVLELGCATGYMGRYLKIERQCESVGIELSAEAAEQARADYQQVVVGSLEDSKTFQAVGEGFDVILAIAVLEHLISPEQVLANLRRKLKPQGILIVALPNIAHWSIRWQLLRGRFDYSDYGILDRTHLRFFTYDTARELIIRSGYAIIQTAIDPDAGLPLINGLIRRLPGGWAFLTQLYNLRPNLLAYQILLRASVS